MNVMQAAYEAVHHGPLNVAALARLLKKSPTTLCHEVKPPPGSQAKLGLQTAMRITDAQNDDRILFAWAEARRFRCVRAHVPMNDNRCDLLQAVSRFGKEAGEALAAMHHAIENGRITENEISRFEREVGDIAPAAISLVERMRALAATQAMARATVVPAARHVPLPTSRSAAAAASL